MICFCDCNSMYVICFSHIGVPVYLCFHVFEFLVFMCWCFHVFEFLVFMFSCWAMVGCMANGSTGTVKQWPASVAVLGLQTQHQR